MTEEQLGDLLEIQEWHEDSMVLDNGMYDILVSCNETNAFVVAARGSTREQCLDILARQFRLYHDLVLKEGTGWVQVLTAAR